MIADRERILKSGNEFNHLIPSPTSKEPFFTWAGDTYATIRYMRQTVNDTLPQTEKLSKKLKGSSLRQTCKNIFDFLYNHIQYEQDKPGIEQLRSPARSWADRRRGIDCDCYSIFASSILTNLGIPHAFRKTKYDRNPKFQHIYVIVPKDEKRIKGRDSYYVIDPVLNGFDKEKKYSQKHDEIMTMPIQSLNGVNSQATSFSPKEVSFTHEGYKYVVKSASKKGLGFIDAIGNLFGGGGGGGGIMDIVGNVFGGGDGGSGGGIMDILKNGPIGRHIFKDGTEVVKTPAYSQQPSVRSYQPTLSIPATVPQYNPSSRDAAAVTQNGDSDKKDNTMMYVGIGFGVLLLGVGGYVAFKK